MRAQETGEKGDRGRVYVTMSREEKTGEGVNMHRGVGVGVGVRLAVE